MNLEKIKKVLEFKGQPSFRLQQITKAICQKGVFSFSEISVIPQDLRFFLEEKTPLLSLQEKKVLASKNKLSFKALLSADAKTQFETVLLCLKEGVWSVCVSCQSGCALGCRFCLSGKNGFKRNLKAEEIVDQVLFWRQFIRKRKLPGKLKNIVFMGMGEPFLNWLEVEKSLAIFLDKNLFNFGSRSISISTAGIVPGIVTLAEKYPQINLAVSLHFTKNKDRNYYMPINRKYDLERIKEALKIYFEKCNRKVFLEYILFQGINDRSEDIFGLVSFVKSFKKKTKLFHVNLIASNSENASFQPPNQKSLQDFKNQLVRQGLNATIRKSFGREISGACGQLAALD